MDEFISEDDLKTFEGWLRYQVIDVATTAPEELERWKGYFNEARERSAATPKVGLMKLQPVSGEYKYAIALREGSDLWLVLWVRRSRKGELFVMMPSGDRDWDIHTSYHLDGTLHIKSRGSKRVTPNKRQPLTGVFRGTENLATFAGYAPKTVGAACDITAFSGIVEVPSGVLGPRHGMITIDLVEPGRDATGFPMSRIIRQDFRDAIPWVVFTIWSEH